MSRSGVVLLLLLLGCVFVMIKSGIFQKEEVPPRYSILTWLPFWPTGPDTSNSFWPTGPDTSNSFWSTGPDTSNSYLNFSTVTICVAAAAIFLSCVFWRCMNSKAHSVSRYEEDEPHPAMNRHWKIYVLCGVLVLFMVSYIWEFIRIYQIERAKKATVLFKGLPLECQPDMMSWWQSLKTWTLSLVAWHHQDSCEKYHMALLVDPVWEVAPPVVLSSLLTRWFLDLIPQLSSAIGQSFQQLFGKLPVQWQLVVFVCGLLVIVLILVMSCGYRIISPILRIEHGSHGNKTNISCCCHTKRPAIKDH